MFLPSFGKIKVSVYSGPTSRTLATDWRREDITPPLTSEAVHMHVRWRDHGIKCAPPIASKIREHQEFGICLPILHRGLCVTPVP